MNQQKKRDNFFFKNNEKWVIVFSQSLHREAETIKVWDVLTSPGNYSRKNGEVTVLCIKTCEDLLLYSLQGIFQQSFKNLIMRK